MSENKNDFENKLDRIVDAGMAKTRRFYTMWNENLRYFFSDQLHGAPQRKNWEWVILNYIWPSAMQEIAKLTKNNPKIIVQPWTQGDEELADALPGPVLAGFGEGREIPRVADGRQDVGVAEAVLERRHGVIQVEGQVPGEVRVG